MTTAGTDGHRWEGQGGTGLPASVLERIEAEPLGSAFRNIPATGLTVGSIAQAHWSVADLMLPTVTLRLSAVRHNAELFARWCSDSGLSHAPHGKTTMAPQLFHLQLASGAWGITAATAAQARAMRGFGVPRILIANQVVDAAGLRWLAAEVGRDPAFDVYVLVDSIACVERMERVLAEAGAHRPVQVLLEIGPSGGRCGARSHEDALAVAASIGDCRHLTLAGVECYEGVLPQDRSAESVDAVRRFLAEFSELVRGLGRRGVFAGRNEVVVTAGGSAYPDLVAEALARLGGVGVPVRPVVRSGGYLTHDHLFYERCSPFAAAARHPAGSLRPALELWAHVLSVPEHGLAVCGFGKREAPYDLDLPVPLARIACAGKREPLADAEVEKLFDHHAYLRHGGGLEVGDTVVFGLSHPCTTFDKWPLIPLLDDADRLVGAVRTFF